MLVLQDRAIDARRPSRAPSDSPLAALAAHALADRFHSWRGASGRRHVCTVFAIDAELPEFAPAILLAVQRLPDGARRLLDVAAIETAADSRLFAARARRTAANELHAHQIAETAAARAGAVADLCRS